MGGSNGRRGADGGGGGGGRSGRGGGLRRRGERRQPAELLRICGRGHLPRHVAVGLPRQGAADADAERQQEAEESAQRAPPTWRQALTPIVARTDRSNWIRLVVPFGAHLVPEVLWCGRRHRHLLSSPASREQATAL